MAHTYNPPCRLAPAPHPDPVPGLEDIPHLKTQFFYSSPIPIDDPLSAATIVGAAENKSTKPPLRPFSPADTLSLEKAWLTFSSDRDRRNHRQSQRNRSPSPSLSKENAAKLAAIVAQLATKHREKHDREGIQTPPAGVICCQELTIDTSAELRKEFCAVTRRRQRSLDHDVVIQGVMEQLKRCHRSVSEQQQQQTGKSSVGGGSIPLLGTSPIPRHVSASVAADGSRPSTAGGDGELPPLAPPPARPPAVGDGISGKPFARAEMGDRDRERSSNASTPEDRSTRQGRGRSESVVVPVKSPVEGREGDHGSVEVPVGISRLHMVSLPVLQMKPIYWSPVNDLATVMRATWFYRDSMVPVDPAVANQLEAGYRELRPWTETWRDEIKSALYVGAVGEEKVAHKLWPDVVDKRSKAKEGDPEEPPISSDPFCAARCFRGEAATEGTLEHVHSEEEAATPRPESRSYASYHVIYKDESAAFLLKPSLKPSAYYGRKPVSKIMKGMAVGIPVVRGFDLATWEKIHEKGKKPSPQPKGKPGSGGQNSSVSAVQVGCLACQQEKDRGQVTDLVLVAHGIGQKFAERVESFHFTHAVNGFRRAVNVELETPLVKSVLRPGQNGIMVLPVNWRHLLSFEDGGPTQEEDKAAYATDGFTLKDIEPTTIPAVRSMISDIMFDIPFYLSHHKPKMIAALVGEANRVYRLWCRNNPGFSERGRVHLIGHSLGSAMALDVLSQQPTRVPRLDLSRPAPNTRFFEFDTTNLFLMGSPAAFFLLLERGGLIPRRGRLKPGADAADTVARDVVGDVGTFGCLAVDNIYNILAREDPVAYLLNGTIDPVYAASLREAYVPTISTSYFKSLSDSIRYMAGMETSSPAATTSTPQTKKPSMPARLPSQLELEVHDFSREEIAEKKAFLLNDNGQVDWYLKSGGGPLEIQYLNMLSAHSSYWTHQDLIRLLCLEVGRKPGRENTLEVMRAAKKGGRGFLTGGDGIMGSER
ncbi:DDHD domain-containing protein [Immersiella caudata]|uniref:DDHD domain-containing protein n=1 Tax=Immersiella caudata TaxID=314043 RepID=A0AA39X2N5_9PEZI|nr:DDHD domain-containing protein [Immersiella caudata]